VIVYAIGIAWLASLAALAWWSARRVRAAERRRRASQQALAEAQRLLVQTEKLAALGQMVAGVAHEINNPLSFVNNNLWMITRDAGAAIELVRLYAEGEAALAAAQPELMERIRARAARFDVAYTQHNLPDLLARSRDGLRRIEQLVNDLRNYARPDDSGRHEVSLDEGVTSTANIARGLAKQKRVEIKLELDAQHPIDCYPAKINQVALNLIVNAIAASPEGGTITLRTSSSAEAARLEVIDAGPGIDPAIRAHIFDPFFTTKPAGEGTGLGLSISRSIVEQHGGRLDVESSPGQGARFIVVLPRRAPTPAEAPLWPAQVK
jgi:signal transduction histidine kinase